MQKLQSDVGRVDAAGGEDGEAGQSAADRRHVPQRDRSNGVARHAAVRRPTFGADTRPRDGVGRLDTHQTGHRVGGSHAVSLTCSHRRPALETSRCGAVLTTKGHIAAATTHTHPFDGPLSGTTRVSRYRKSNTNLDFTEAPRDSEWQWHQLGHMQVCTSLQTDNQASTLPLSFLQAGCPSCRPTNSVNALLQLIHYYIIPNKKQEEEQEIAEQSGAKYPIIHFRCTRGG